MARNKPQPNYRPGIFDKAGRILFSIGTIVTPLYLAGCTLFNNPEPTQPTNNDPVAVEVTDKPFKPTKPTEETQEPTLEQTVEQETATQESTDIPVTNTPTIDYNSIDYIAEQIEAAIQDVILYSNNTDDSADGLLEFSHSERIMDIDPVILQYFGNSDFTLYLRELIDGEPTGLLYRVEIKDGELYVNTYENSINSEGDDSPAWVGGNGRTYDLALGPKDDPELPELVPIDDSDVELTYLGEPTSTPGPTSNPDPTPGTTIKPPQTENQ